MGGCYRRWRFNEESFGKASPLLVPVIRMQQLAEDSGRWRGGGEAHPCPALGSRLRAALLNIRWRSEPVPGWMGHKIPVRPSYKPEATQITALGHGHFERPGAWARN